MRKRIITILCLVVVLALIGILTIRASERISGLIQPAVIKDVPLTWQSVKSSYLYEALTAKEKIIYHQITDLLDQHRGGEIILEQPIDVLSMCRIDNSLTSEREEYWYYFGSYTFNEDNELVEVDKDNTLIKETVDGINDKKLIYKIIIFIDSETYQREMALYYEQDLLTLKKKWDEQGLRYEAREAIWTMRNGEEVFDFYQTLKNDVASFIDTDLSYYVRIDEEIEETLQSIINDMPKDLNQEESVYYFGQWLVDNMVYDYEAREYILISRDTEKCDVRKVVSSSRNTAVLTKEGVCAGITSVLATLCKMVGIEAINETVIVKYSQGFYGGLHVWTVVKIDDELFYTEPTAAVAGKERFMLRTKEMHYSRFPGFEPIFDLFEDS
jgi:hypothetical protein